MASSKISIEAAEKAFALRDRTPSRERLLIEARDHETVKGEVERAIEIRELYSRTYPEEPIERNNLTMSNARIGRFERAVEEADTAIRLGMNAVQPYSNKAWALVGLNRFDEAAANIAEAHALGMDAFGLHYYLYQIGSINEDEAALKRQLDWFTGRPDAVLALGFQMERALFSGRAREAQALSRQATAVAAQNGPSDLLAWLDVPSAIGLAMLGRCREARQAGTRARSHWLNWDSLGPLGMAFAVCGDSSGTDDVARELDARFPTGTMTKAVWLPSMRAALAIRRGAAAEALQLLEATTPYERAGWLVPASLRGQAYLRLGRGADARTAFQRVLDHRGEAPLSPLYPAAHLGLGRAMRLLGDRAASRAAYEKLLAIWKDADADIPALVEAKHEYAALAAAP